MAAALAAPLCVESRRKLALANGGGGISCGVAAWRSLNERCGES